ncbi:unnamed protein product, partial [Discosporangium mesarthrocarpum]
QQGGKNFFEIHNRRSKMSSGLVVAERESDVLIIGAGLSGLSAALTLVDSEYDGTIAIVEGRDRVGGRLHAHAGVDVGGAWCWLSAHHGVPSLAKRLGIHAFPQYQQGWNLLDRGISVARTKDAFDSAKLRFKGGAFAITTALAAHLKERGVRLQLGWRVTHVSTELPNELQVRGIQDDTEVQWKAKVLLLATPPRVALPPSIEWVPQLPSRVASAMRDTPTWMAQTTKVLVTYPHPFWRDKGYSGDALSEGGGPIQQLYDSCGADGGEPAALCGFILSLGHDNPPPDDVLKPQVVEQLGRMFGEDASSPLEFSTHRWGAQPLTSANGGATGGGHTSSGHSLLRKPFGGGYGGAPGRVWICSAETDDRHSGLMEGALLSGRRAAEGVSL